MFHVYSIHHHFTVTIEILSNMYSYMNIFNCSFSPSSSHSFEQVKWKSIVL